VEILRKQTMYFLWGLNIQKVKIMITESNTVISYNGEMNSELCRGLILAVHSQILLRENNLLVRKRITHIITECILNLSHHAEVTSSVAGSVKSVKLLVQDESTHYIIRTSNFISSGKVDFLTCRLNGINEMNTLELYTHYMQQLQSGQYTKKGTAGLGFIDIARKAGGNKLLYEFQLVGESKAYFSFQITVNK
jgi:hypothetical protein